VKVLKCVECDSINNIVSVEKITVYYKAYLDKEDKLMVNERETFIESEIDSIQCLNCKRNYGTNSEDLEILIVEEGEKNE
jgi:hypothetical protein